MSTTRAHNMKGEAMCQSCKELSVVGIKCNAHRTESTSTRLIREATAQGFTLTGDVVDQALQAESLLGARPVVLS